MNPIKNDISLSIILLSIAFSNMSCSNKIETLGAIAENYEIGEVLYDSNFNNPDDWIFQVEATDSPNEPNIAFENGILDIYMPDRGCTAWLKQKFKGPIAITYRVKCPKETLSYPEIQARDINNFWHASDPEIEDGLFDPSRYTGKFGSYHKMHGYYASTGGGGKEGNHTTRFRRYPRNDPNDNPLPHIALNDRDENPDYLITPGKWHTVQLVAAEGIAQYIVDGKLVYQIKESDTVAIEQSDKAVIEKVYTFEEFPIHNEGYLGLRLVKSHHQYADLKVHQLTTKQY